MHLSAVNNLSVLFVDDQPLLLKMIYNVIQFKAPDWNIRLAGSGSEALQFLEEESSEIIVSDMNMPGMDGMSLLQTVREKHPNLLRFILSGQSSKNNILSSVGVAHQFLNKPIQMNELVEALELSRSLYRRIQDPGLQKMISTVGTFPTPREVYFKITNMLNDSEVELSDISEVVSEDVAISAKILQLVNSAFFGRGSRVDSINEAVSVLGIQNIRSLILVVGFAAEQDAELNTMISIDAYAQHALEVGQLSRWIAKRSGLKREEQDSLFTAGLLHNIGKLVVVDHHKDYYQENGIQENPYEDQLHIEELGIEENRHALIGAALLALWGLPAKIINAVAFHHDPEDSSGPQSNYAMLVHVAEAITNFNHCSDAEKSIFDSRFINTKYVEELELRDEIERWMIEYKEELEH